MKLDASKMLGFRLIAADADRVPAMGARLGGKTGTKLGSKFGTKLGSKFGTKLGSKFGFKRA